MAKKYLDRDQFYREILKWKQNKPNDVGNYFILIATHLLGRSEFRGYSKSQQDDMVSYALYKCVKGLHTFKRQKTITEGGKKAFAYFSTACYYAFLTELSRYYKRINAQRDIEDMYISKMETEYPELGRKMREDKDTIKKWYE